jgi:hypothetical protein
VVNGNMTINSIVIKEHIVNFYQQLCSEQCMWRPKVYGLSFLSIDDGEKIWMEREFEESQVLEVVRNFNGDKVPRPHGFSMAFFQKYWEVLKRTLWQCSMNSIVEGSSRKSFNATFVSIILKKAGAVEIKDFHPINLVGRGVQKYF